MQIPIETALGERLGKAFEAQGLPATLGATARSTRPDLAPYQCNGAMAAAKQAGKPPREIAQTVADAVSGDPLIESVEIAGPGFINLTPSAKALEDRANALAEDDRAGARIVDEARTVVIDFGGPNVAKPMHVGHLRSSIIGDSLQRLFRFCGDKVIGDVHLGDWGLQMGQIITELAREKPDLPYFDKDFEGPYPDESPVTIEELETIYPRASQACKANEARMDEARMATQALQEGRPGYIALWRHFLEVSRAALKRDFAALDVHFDLWKGESDVQDRIRPMVADLVERDIATEDKGAIVIPVAREDDKKELPPFILLKSDGAALYTTTDLATILDRSETLDPDLILYVVDKRQSLHFEQVFRAAQKSGFAEGISFEHLAYGTMNGPDGKPFKTRAGGVLKLADLLDRAHRRAVARMEEAGIASNMEKAEYEAVADKVALAAIKFADLSHDRATDYIFDLDRFMTFEGKTGPYLLYAAVRVKSLMRKAADAGVEPGEIRIKEKAEADLLYALDAFDRASATAYEKRAPNFLCDHAYTLAQAFSGFYSACPIVTAEDAETRASRLALAQLTLTQLNLVLGLIGLEAPDRM
ncbi:MAG: arginine--tRNA ligase [Euryhalocaulis sp.]|uniref:arginine--tRNA ligase n=1 Tax=Euryhalocaulis sp. TaxID=2744307 RepID=UPI0017EAF01D|nr:arginine--tRNA ligase [Euryhalocaulis sp.]MBA4801767.1 arginine--tRNA ligase [Euryhalocaulis sp.]